MLSRGVVALFSLIPVAVLQSEYWVDERIVIMLTERWGLYGILTKLPRNQPHLPTWYLLPEFFGPLVAEAVSVACVPVSVLFTIRAAAELYDEESALVAGLIIACSPLVAAQGGWLRMYSMLTAVSALTLWLVLAGDDRSSWAALGAAALHPFGATMPLWNAIVTRTRRSVMALGTTLVASAWYAHMKLTKQPYQGSADSLKFKTGMGHGVVPPWYELVSALGASVGGSPRFRFGIVGAAIVGTVALHTDKRVALWAAGYPLALLVVSAVVHPVWQLKYLGIIAPAVAVGFADPRSGRWRVAGFVAFAIGAGVNFYLGAMGADVAKRMYFWFL